MGNRNTASGNHPMPLPKPLKFHLGRVMITPGAATTVADDQITDALRRHQCGDWGLLDSREKKCNEQALRSGGWILSAYNDPKSGERFLIITQPNRIITTDMVPNEFGE